MKRETENTQTIYGKSSDTKPTTVFDGLDVAEGWVFYEVDTQKAFIFDGANWVEQ